VIGPGSRDVARGARRARRAGRALFVVAAAALSAKIAVVGCDDTGSYIFSGEQYDPLLQCLEPVASIDVVAGSPPGSCGPVCILTVPQDGGQIAYVSTMCGPYPVYPFEADAGSDPLCVAAMAAFTRNALCEDGGVVVLNGSDAAADAGADANAPETSADAGDATSPAADAGGGEASAPNDAADDVTVPVDATGAPDAPTD
jgi:hypothetical protein